MEIRKEFSFKGTHRVVNCFSKLCKFSIHGHLYIVEIFITAEPDKDNKILDNGQMIYDFGLTKTTFKEFISSFNNTHAIWNKESEDYKNKIKTINKRWVELPCSPSAESLSILFLRVLNDILLKTITNNGEKKLIVSKIRVHETRTGYAEAILSDLSSIDYNIGNIIYSCDVFKQFSETFKRVMFDNEGVFINEKPLQQV